jgi:pimeloyl-ACP methyl ester carboxylesterase
MLGALCLVPLVLVFPTRSGRANEPDSREQGASAFTLSAVDGNPKFLEGVQWPVKPDGLSQTAPSLLNQRHVRKGVAADGVSLLIIRASCQRPGTATFSLAGGEPMGRLGMLCDPEAQPTGIPAIASNGRFAALCVYTPPDDFGERYAGEGAFSRPVEVRVDWKLGDGGSAAGALRLEIVRPPVVLVHGLYQGPASAWEAASPTEWGAQSLAGKLRQRGFRVFLTDYEKSNGRPFAGPSHIRDNQKVVWENAGGIRQALESYRQQGYAATQVDVVGHSMGGILARAYALGKWLSPCEHTQDKGGTAPSDVEPSRVGHTGARRTGAADTPNTPDKETQENWYRRPDNFYKGDIRRLITLCTPHQGSDLVDVILKYREACDALPARPEAKALLQLLDLTHGISTGALADSASSSQALREIGATPIPAHAIACLAEAEDFSHFNQRYRWNFIALALLAPRDMLELVFAKAMDERRERAEAMLEFLRENQELLRGIYPIALAANLGGKVADEPDASRRKQYTRVVKLLTEAVFAGRHDGAVQERSSHGGLREEYVSSVPHALHSFAARYPAVQQRILELLEGSAESFAPTGFPALREP